MRRFRSYGDRRRAQKVKEFMLAVVLAAMLYMVLYGAFIIL